MLGKANILIDPEIDFTKFFTDHAIDTIFQDMFVAPNAKKK